MSAPNPIVPVDRTTSIEKLVPFWVCRFRDPGIQNEGPLEFDVRTIERHTLLDQQAILADTVTEEKFKILKGSVILEFHQRKGLLKNDFGIRELRGIQLRGHEFHEAYLPGIISVGWRSVVYNGADQEFVPFLMKRGDAKGLVLDWCWVDNAHFHIRGTALRHKKIRI